MNEASLKNLRPRWQPGESGNINGRPARSNSWAVEGPKVLSTLARTQPAVYAGLAAKLVPADVSISLEARMPAGLDPSDWQLMMTVLDGVKQALPDANTRAPGEVLEFVASAIRAHSATTIEIGHDVANVLPNAASGEPNGDKG
jgi:hypothetical protein